MASTPKYQEFLKRTNPTHARIDTNCPVPHEIRDKFKDERVELEEKMIQCIKRIIEGNFSDISEFFSVKKSNEMIEAL